MHRHPSIVVAEDDPSDRHLLQIAFRRNAATVVLDFVGDGAELLDYLRGQGRWSPPPPLPRLILLDLHMPRVDGRAALGIIKANHRLRRIPIVVFTTSRAAADVDAAYNLGANSYLCKPSGMDALVASVGALVAWWFHTAMVPADLVGSPP